ncbi:MAG: DUF4386 domain-containing protein [Eubacteriales bacterium]
METTKNNRKLMIFLGIVLFTQAVTSLVGGSIFLGPFDTSEITSAGLSSIADNALAGYISIVLQMITGAVIIMLAAAMYSAAGHKNKTMGIIALGMYIFETVLLSVDQVFVFGLIETAKIYVETGDASLIAIGTVLMTCKEFAGNIAMIPFGIGAVLFYYLLMKAQVLPKWLALWGIIAAPLILIGVPLMAFGVDIPFAVLVPYVPFEFFAGIFILVKYLRKKEA